MLITEDYRKQIAEVHATTPGWGTTGRHFASLVQKIARDYAVSNILDYGCGKQTLSRALPAFRIKGYDPGLPGLDIPPEPHDLVVCTDVLEHIEPDCLEAVLDDLQRVTRIVLFAQVATSPAIQILPDGRNAHLIVEPAKWWLRHLWERFDLISCYVDAKSTQFLLHAMTPKGNGRH